MTRRDVRKTAPKVRNGKVQRKNRWQLSPHYSLAEPGRPVIERHRPGVDGRHLLRKRDVERFVEILPDWQELSRGLKAILLTSDHDDCMGWYAEGIVAICSWSRELAGRWDHDFVVEHAEVMERLGVEWEKVDGDTDYVHWTENSARGFQLMHIFLHELGHHHDRMTTASELHTGRGEGYAERYANEYADRIWDDYFRIFPW